MKRKRLPPLIFLIGLIFLVNAACSFPLLTADTGSQSTAMITTPSGTDSPSVLETAQGEPMGTEEPSAEHVDGPCPIFPQDNFWNIPVGDLPVHPRSDDWINAIGANSMFHADFGSGTWDGGPIGIPYNIVPADQPLVEVTFDEYGEESDPGPYPIPEDALREWGSDHHILILQEGTCILYELYHSHLEGNDWYAGSGAFWNLNSNDFRPEGWTSSDLAGLAIYPGLVKYDEAASGEIRHALRFTAFNTAEGYIWPARHPLPNLTDSQYDLDLPPIGARFRLKASYPIPEDAPVEIRALLQVMKTYGIILADHGSEWYISGSPDERWDNDLLHYYFDENLQGSDFEAVDVTSIMVNPDSGAAAQ